MKKVLLQIWVVALIGLSSCGSVATSSKTEGLTQTCRHPQNNGCRNGRVIPTTKVIKCQCFSDDRVNLQLRQIVVTNREGQIGGYIAAQKFFPEGSLEDKRQQCEAVLHDRNQFPGCESYVPTCILGGEPCVSPFTAGR